MPRYIYYTATTLDGFLADQNDSLDWLFAQEQDEAGPQNYEEFITGIGVLVMGATTYEWVMTNHVAKGEPWMYSQPTLVFTHRALEPVDESVLMVAGTPADHRKEIEKAAGDKDVWVVGGGDLAAQFAEAGMLDEVQLSIAPVVLGAGRPLFPRRYDLELLDHARNGAFLTARYRVLGPLRTDARSADGR